MNQLFHDIIKKFNFDGYKLIPTNKIVVSQRVRIKCSFGCENYGSGSCPPNVPTITECKEFFNEYSNAIIIRILININQNSDNINKNRNDVDLTNVKLLELEKEFFKAGYPFAFVFYHSNCSKKNIIEHKCDSRINCSHKSDCRPCPTSFGVDMYSTLKQNNIDIVALEPNSEYYYKYSILLID